MRLMTHLQIAITPRGAELLRSETRSPPWGPAEQLFYAGGHVFGRSAPPQWPERFSARVRDLTTVSLWPMFDLPRDVAPPDLAAFANALREVLTASGVWILWCEYASGQHQREKKVMSAGDVARQVQRALVQAASFARSAPISLIALSAERLPPGDT
jgi:hypothetical protein